MIVIIVYFHVNQTMEHVWLLLIICFDEILWDIDLWSYICCDVWLCSSRKRIVEIFCVWTYIINVINIINQCYFIFALRSIIELDTYCYLIFYRFTLIHLIDPLSQMVQIICVIYDIYIYIYIYFFLSWKKVLNLGCRKEKAKLIWTCIFIPSRIEHHRLSIFLDINQAQKWLFMTLINILFIVI